MMHSQSLQQHSYTHINMASSAVGPSITLRQEQTVLEILRQVGSNRHIDLDEQLESLIKQGEQQIYAEYEAQAEQRMLVHRQGINFDELKQNIELQIKQQINPEPPAPLPNQLQLFQHENLRKIKVTEQQIMQLDREFPKLNYTGMIGKQQSIFQLKVPQAAKWISHKHRNIEIAVMAVIGDKRWIMLGVENELVIFRGEDQKQPTIMSLTGKIGALGISPCKKYIAVGVKSQINLYQIRKGTSLVLLKNFSDPKINTICRLVCYQGEGPRLCFVDQKGTTGFISLEMGLILTKVKIDQVIHSLKRVDSCDVIRVNSQTALLAIGGAGSFQLVKIEPQIEYYQRLQFTGRVICSWRKQRDRTNLLIGSGNRMTIYKLIYDSDDDIYYLEEYLMFLNHYPIENMFKLTQYHYLLQSESNFAVVALPLIPSVVDDPDLALSEAALVFSFERDSQNRVIFGVQDGLLLMWKNLIQLGRLRNLDEELDELMIQRCAFREAFSLLVLVSKGINYSFNFSYNPSDLRRLVHSAVQIATTALIPSLDERIVLFRVGWIVQMCIQCGEEEWMWTYLYPNLKERHLEKHLFNMLQMFILKGQLISIPQDIFLDIVSYYSQRGKEVVIQKLVLSNREQYEATKLLSLLNQRQMNYLQFYLFSRAILSEQNDFYTPFIRAFSAFVRNLDHHTDKVNQSALLCYWILNKTFRFEHIPSGHMTRDTKLYIVTNFFLQSLSKTFIRRLSDYNLKLYLQAYINPFLNQQFMDIIFEEESQIMASFKQYDTNGEIVLENEFVNAFLNYMEYCVGVLKGSALFAEFYCTILYLTKSQAKFERVVELLATLFEKKFYSYELRINAGTRPAVYDLKEYLLNMIAGDLTKRADRLYIKKLLVFEDHQVGHLIHRLDLNFQTALQIYLNNYRTDGIFEFISSIHSEIEQMVEDSSYTKERKKMEVRGFIMKNIGLLFRSDCNAALDICYLIGETTQKIHDIVFKNPFQNNQKIFFLTAVLNRWSNQEYQYKQQYLLEHLEEVCSLPESDMRKYLNKFYYPLDSAIKVADRKNNYLAKAILEMRSGMIQQAFASYEKLIQNTLTTNKELEETRTKVGCYLEQCVAICKQYSGQNLEENLWIRLIKFLSNFVASEQQYKVYLKVQLQRSTQNIINEMLQFLSTTLLIDFFTSPEIPLPLYKLIPIYGDLFRMIKFDRWTIQRSMLIEKLDIIDLRKKITQQSRFGTSWNGVCDFCRGRLEEEHLSLGYSCGHAFHKLCHENDSMCLTCSYESDQGLFYKAIFKKNLPPRESTPSKQKEKKKIEMTKQIYVQTRSQVLMDQRKKKLKVFDFDTDQKQNSIYDLSNRHFRIGALELSSE